MVKSRGCLAIDNKVDVVLCIDKVVSFLTEKENSLPTPFLHPSLRPPFYTEQAVILRTSTHNLFPVLMLVVMHVTG